MKKILAFICSLTMIFIVVSPVSAKNSVDVDVTYLSPTLEEYIVTDGDEKHIITIDRETYVLTIDGEKFVPKISEIPMTRATVDYSSGLYLEYDIPWRGAAAMTAAIMAAVPGLGWTIAGAIVGAIAAEGEKLYITLTQYSSKESYYSSYTCSYYKKAINKNIKAYSKSISPSNLIYGPVDGAWFDPVRP